MDYLTLLGLLIAVENAIVAFSFARYFLRKLPQLFCYIMCVHNWAEDLSNRKGVVFTVSLGNQIIALFESSTDLRQVALDIQKEAKRRRIPVGIGLTNDIIPVKRDSMSGVHFFMYLNRSMLKTYCEYLAGAAYNAAISTEGGAFIFADESTAQNIGLNYFTQNVILLGNQIYIIP